MSSFPNADCEELLSLVTDYCDGSISEAAGERMQTILRTSGEARSVYVQYLDLHLALRRTAKSSAGNTGLAVTEHHATPSAVAPRSALGFLSSAVALVRVSPVATTLCVALCVYGTFGLLVWQMSHLKAIPQSGEIASTFVKPRGHRPVATLVQSDNCRWQRTTINDGDLLFPGMLRLIAGRAELKFNDGARVILEGPTEFEVRSANSSFLQLGKLTARVPKQAIGFAVTTPRANVVDLGTEFGVEVSPGGETAVQVFQGAVEFAQLPLSIAKKESHSKSPVQKLRAGEAARTDGASRTIVTADFVPDKFPRQISRVAKPWRGEAIVDLSGARVTQSTLFPEGRHPPEAAIDGDPKTFSHTTHEDPASWWQVDLGRVRPVAAIVIHNEPWPRGWLRDITIRVLAEDGKTVVGRSAKLNPKNCLGGGEEDFDRGPVQLDFSFTRGNGEAPVGRFVRIERELCTLPDGRMKPSPHIANKCCLELAEVEIFELREQPVTETPPNRKR